MVNQPGEAAETVAAAARLAFSTGRAVAVLISQRVIGYKTFGK
jgi:sulfopyruvate decarboxylase TPP-binding subunit